MHLLQCFAQLESEMSLFGCAAAGSLLRPVGICLKMLPLRQDRFGFDAVAGKLLLAAWPANWLATKNVHRPRWKRPTIRSSVPTLSRVRRWRHGVWPTNALLKRGPIGS